MTPSQDIPSTRRWDCNRANAWCKHLRATLGFNYLPRTAINSIEMWQAESFDLETIKQELKWASSVGLNSARVFLSFTVWFNEPEGIKERFERLLDAAAAQDISVMPVLFDDCAFGGREPSLGPQGDPVAGVHNSGWVPSPGLTLVGDRTVWRDLESYVKGVIGAFRDDSRILAWDLYNEPGNSQMGEKSLPLLTECFAWARAVDPVQPLTAGPWLHASEAGRLNDFMYRSSDVVSFHAYTDAASVQHLVKDLAALGRPLFCTEWLHRLNDNSFAAILPIWKEFDVHWYMWGLVAGRSQTYLPWKANLATARPGVWQHDILAANGTPYDAAEIVAIQRHLLERRAPASNANRAG